MSKLSFDSIASILEEDNGKIIVGGRAVCIDCGRAEGFKRYFRHACSTRRTGER